MFIILFFILSLNVYAGENPCELALMDLGRLKYETLYGKMPRVEALLVGASYKNKIRELAASLNISQEEAEGIVAEYIQQNRLKIQSSINKTKESSSTNLNLGSSNLDLEKVFKATDGTGKPDADGILRRPHTIEAIKARQWFSEILMSNAKSLDNKYLQVLLSFAEENNQMDLLLDLDPILFKYTPVLKANETVEFTMGSSNEEQEKQKKYYLKIPDEIKVTEKQHQVRLTKPYGLTQLISVGAWKIVENGKLPPDYGNTKSRDEEPVRHVSWNMGMDHLKKLNERARKLFKYPENYNLFDYPTEAEWEYAVRLNETGKPQRTAFSWGDDWEEERGWENDGTKKAYDGGEFPLIGLKKPTGKGLSDMHKVLSQWCKDEFKDTHGDPNKVSIDPGHDPVSDLRARCLRGASVWISPVHARAARRYGDSPWLEWYYLGLRIRQDGQ